MAQHPRLRIGTRKSPLARAQARAFADALGRLDPALAAEGVVELVFIKTSGDRFRAGPLADIGGKGLFTKEIDEALLERTITMAVHSLKDVPTVLNPGLVIGCVPAREDPRDALIAARARSLAELAPGTVVGTASLRRRAQVLALRPDLSVVPLRGNVETRIRRVREGAVGATLLALAGLRRLNKENEARGILSPDEMLPAVGQGALAIICRADDRRTRTLLAALDHGPTRAAVTAERALLAALDGSCRTPIAALAEIVDGARLRLRGLVARADGRDLHRMEGEGPIEKAQAIGHSAGSRLAALAGPALAEMRA